MRLRVLAFACCLTLPVFAQQILVPRAEEFASAGRFREATALLQSVARDSTYEWSPLELRTLDFEIERLRRIRLDYALTKEELYAQLARAVTGLTQEEFDGWIAGGRFDALPIDDTLRFLGVSRSNLFWRYPALRERRARRPDDSASEHSLLAACRAITKAAALARAPYVLPRTFVATLRVTVDSGVVPSSGILRVWLPIPREYPYQKDFALLSSSSPPKAVADARAPLRCAYFEQQAGAHPAVWERFRYTRYGVRFALDAGEARPFDGDDSVARAALAEGPHIVFTEKIRKLCHQLAGTEVNPLIKAKRFHDWISENVQYSYAREYSTIRNLSDYCFTQRYGDCGQHALLFITLCRSSGIPARWQSGWYTFPGDLVIHDWAEVYIDPYGWIPVDPDMGVFAMQYFTTLAVEQRRELRDFYFGGLDQFRMAANGEHCADLIPAKRSFRSDTVDFQRGELEWGDRNLYFDVWSYNIENVEGRH